MKMKQTNITLSNGETIFFRSSGSDSQALLLIHGNLCSGRHLESFIPYLDPRYTFFVPDMRGFGNSSYQNPIRGISDFSEDLELFARALHLDTFSLLGWSAGGCICMDYGLKYPSRVNSLILAETVGYQGCPLMTPDGLPFHSALHLQQEPSQVAPAHEMILNQDLASMKRLWDQVMYVHARPEPDEERQLLKASLKQRNLVEMYWALCQFNLSPESNGYCTGKGIPDTFSIPTMFTWGTEDTIVTLEEIRATADAFHSDHLFLLENCGHNPFLDCPHKLSQQILQFESKQNLLK